MGQQSARFHLLPVDHNLHGAEANKPAVRAIVHVHGAKTPPESDGYPGRRGTCPASQRPISIPTSRTRRLLWYHDHAMGITRLNVYAGLFGLFTIRDLKEDALNLPRGPYEIPLIIYDRSFRRDGRLDYPVSGISDAPWVPEAMGEAMIVNGKMFPHLDVEPRKYRFRVLNAANGRFFHLSLSNKDQFQVIGSDQGLMEAPAAVDSVLIAPGERADLVIDFSGHAGEQIVLDNGAFQVMQFRVSRDKTADSSLVPAKLRDVPQRRSRARSGPGESC